jgi:hypothetical protein
MNIEYQGQGIGTLLLECVKQATGNERLPKSTHNPYVFNTLLDAKKTEFMMDLLEYRKFKRLCCVGYY